MIRPLFSAMKTRPSGANWTTVGWVRPAKRICSWNPDGRAAGAAASGPARLGLARPGVVTGTFRGGAQAPSGSGDLAGSAPRVLAGAHEPAALLPRERPARPTRDAPPVSPPKTPRHPHPSPQHCSSRPANDRDPASRTVSALYSAALFGHHQPQWQGGAFCHTAIRCRSLRRAYRWCGRETPRRSHRRRDTRRRECEQGRNVSSLNQCRELTREMTRAGGPSPEQRSGARRTDLAVGSPSHLGISYSKG